MVNYRVRSLPIARDQNEARLRPMGTPCPGVSVRRTPCIYVGKPLSEPRCLVLLKIHSRVNMSSADCLLITRAEGLADIT